jgi:hypothetical protein
MPLVFAIVAIALVAGTGTIVTASTFTPATGTTGLRSSAARPGAPRIVAAVANSDMTLSFRPPASDGGSRITGYRATCRSSNGGVPRTSDAGRSPAVVTRPTKAKLYRCRVAARNRSGFGTYSAPTAWLLAGVPVHVASPPRRVRVIGPHGDLRSALRSLRAGDVLLLRGGTYSDKVAVTVAPGTARAPVVVARYPGERPVIKGLFWVTSPSYYTFYGINVTWSRSDSSSEHLVKLTNGIGWTFTHAEVWGAHSYAGLLVAGTRRGRPSHWTISNSCIHDTHPTHDTNQDHLIYANTGVNSGRGRIVHDLLFNARNGEGVKIAGARSGLGSSNITVSHSTIYNTAQSLLVGYSSHNTVIARNILSRVARHNGNIRGYELTGKNNQAMQNVGYDARTLIDNYNGGVGVRNAGGNLFPVNPEFNNTNSCHGFRPTRRGMSGYGRWSS